ncbi:head-tail joining protein [Pseudorhodoplanes sinuspersici]|uniref:Uncharacterized protein n=1 Tax=Pseudorhodoplanes sinuspersici TaxID=1235591 RepID=A0A1W6ZWP9_9HYPH|nr:hypothetical protein [Pseudorhodoplanes sinuspersici]ARQ01708.1 hypothetical protein CAK95_23345 [Pseudorhodoplanes sinuspersici]RKE73441.1 ATP-binding sugar transporter Gifsy-2 [Pseudorhodoplanes sinuspersici]
MSVFDLAPELVDALYAAGIPGAAVLTVQTIGGTALEPTVIDTPHICAAWVDDYEASQVDGTSILRNDRKVYVVASSLSVTPVAGNTITINGSTYTVINVERDPAGACFVLQART